MTAKEKKRRTPGKALKAKELPREPAAEEVFKEAERLAHIGSFRWDLSNDTVSLSDGSFTILGIDPVDFKPVGDTFLELIDPGDRERIVQSLKVKSDEPLEFKVIRPNGETRSMLFKLSCFDKKKSVLAGLLQDVTEQKNMEREFLKAQKSESIGKLADNIAHDLNNLLLGILGSATMAKGYLEPDAKVYEILNDVERSSRRAKGLIRRLLTVSKGGEPVKEAASIEELLKSSVNIVLRGSNVRCEYSFPRGLWLVDMDEGQISQVINNIVLNAMHSMPEGGAIEAGAVNIVVSGHEGLPLKPGKYVKATIKDHGTGIPEDLLGRIFEPFFTTKKKASGLGLTLCHSIIKKHNGYIHAESKVGKGSSFHLYLPFAGKEVDGYEDKRPLPGKGGGRVLVMDDEEIVRTVSVEMLKFLGYKAELASDGKEAIELFRKAKDRGERFDAAILDITVPGGIGGVEVLREFRKIDPSIKAIVSSGHSRDPVIAGFRDYGFNGVLIKPYNISEFGKVIKDALGHK